MPNFNRLERGSLMDLISSLGSGLSGDQGAAILQSILGQQQGRVDERQARMASLTDMLAGQAQAGIPYEGSEAIANAMTPAAGVPNRVQTILNDLYPEAPTSYGLGSDSAAIQGNLPGVAEQRLSPLAPGPEAMTPQDQLAQMEVLNQQAASAQAPLLAESLYQQVKLGIEEGTVTPDTALSVVAQEPTFTALPPMAQLEVLRTISTRLQVEAEAQAQAEAEAATNTMVPNPRTGLLPGADPETGYLPGETFRRY